VLLPQGQPVIVPGGKVADVQRNVSDGQSLHAEYLVGCDGGRSPVRKSAGIDFPGSDPTTSNLIAEVEITEEPEWGIRRDALGIHGLSRLGDGPVRVVVTERQAGATGEPTLGDLSEASSPCMAPINDPAGGVLPQGTGAAGRRCRTIRTTASASLLCLMPGWYRGYRGYYRHIMLIMVIAGLGRAVAWPLPRRGREQHRRAVRTVCRRGVIRRDDVQHFP